MGGAQHALGLGSEDEGGKAIAFQPLRHIDRADERAWEAEWIGALLAHEMIVVTPAVKQAVWSALTNLATDPVEQSTLNGLYVAVPSGEVHVHLQALTLLQA